MRWSLKITITNKNQIFESINIFSSLKDSAIVAYKNKNKNKIWGFFLHKQNNNCNKFDILGLKEQILNDEWLIVDKFKEIISLRKKNQSKN
jgi:hypothetical protein